MTEKDKASPRQRQIMEERWAKARRECPEGTCVPSSRFHVAGCQRRTNKAVTLSPGMKIKVTNLNTGVVSEAATVKEAMDANDKQAILLEPETWTPFEKGQRAELFEPLIQPRQDKIPAPTTYMPPEPAPARPWWKFWGRRG